MSQIKQTPKPAIVICVVKWHRILMGRGSNSLGSLYYSLCSLHQAVHQRELPHGVLNSWPEI